MGDLVKWLLRGVLLLVVFYVLFFGAVLAMMLRPPEQFGAMMQHLPQALVWGALPAATNVAVGAWRPSLRRRHRSGFRSLHSRSVWPCGVVLASRPASRGAGLRELP